VTTFFTIDRSVKGAGTVAAVAVRVVVAWPGTPRRQRQQITADGRQHLVVHIDRIGARPPPEWKNGVDDLVRYLFGDEFPNDGVANVTGFLGLRRVAGVAVVLGHRRVHLMRTIVRRVRHYVAANELGSVVPGGEE
jgi:hypothetical protein